MHLSLAIADPGPWCLRFVTLDCIFLFAGRGCDPVSDSACGAAPVGGSRFTRYSPRRRWTAGGSSPGGISKWMPRRFVVPGTRPSTLLGRPLGLTPLVLWPHPHSRWLGLARKILKCYQRCRTSVFPMCGLNVECRIDVQAGLGKKHKKFSPHRSPGAVRSGEIP